MSWKRIYAVYLRQYYLIKTNPTRLASMFLWTIVNILMWGFISKYLGTFGSATFSLVTVLLGAIILWDWLTRIQQGIMFAFLEDVWTQNFINFFASPLKIKEYLSGMVMTSLMTSIIGFVVMVIFAGIAFGYDIFIIGLFLLPFIFILLVFGIAIGVFVCALVFRLGPTAEWIAWPIPFVLSIFSGVYYPISTMPQALRAIAMIFPSSYVFESMRAIVSQGTFTSGLVWNLIFGLLLAFAYLLATYIFFISVYRHNLKSGGLARFSAET
jgi:ABC-2 type transport system permease protein